MCKKTYVHRMHHDVRTPMIMNPHSESQPIYANPRHTSYHRCEVTKPKPGQWLLNKPWPFEVGPHCHSPSWQIQTATNLDQDHEHAHYDDNDACEYHSCCMPEVFLEICGHFHQTRAYLEEMGSPDHDPEDCEYFTSEHRHERLAYFGHPNAYYPDLYQATWRKDMEEIECRWLPWFKRDPRELSKWENVLFSRCEKMYRLEKDARTQFLVYRDLTKFWPPGDPQLKIAEQGVESVQTELDKKKKDVTLLLNWSQCIPPTEPVSPFERTWARRMWAVKNNSQI
ncbi:hypothetical protein GGR54DRAFT_553534 [Hypoxylon sp. NC1633]|nr:hypothetical protein GGR54DRAFT_553534 [Hypoxylon sp. NC1633]